MVACESRTEGAAVLMESGLKTHTWYVLLRPNSIMALYLEPLEGLGLGRRLQGPRFLVLV